jgi:hypothetical protein
MALCQIVAQAEFKEMARGDVQGQSESESEPAQTHAAIDGLTEEPPNDRPKVSDKASK